MPKSNNMRVDKWIRDSHVCLDSGDADRLNQQKEEGEEIYQTEKEKISYFTQHYIQELIGVLEQQRQEIPEKPVEVEDSEGTENFEEIEEVS